MDFEEYFKKMCGNSSDDSESNKYKVSEAKSSFNKKELRWLKQQLEACIEWDDVNQSISRSKKINYEKMLEKVEERLQLL